MVQELRLKLIARCAPHLLEQPDVAVMCRSANDVNMDLTIDLNSKPDDLIIKTKPMFYAKVSDEAINYFVITFVGANEENH